MLEMQVAVIVEFLLQVLAIIHQFGDCRLLCAVNRWAMLDSDETDEMEKTHDHNRSDDAVVENICERLQQMMSVKPDEGMITPPTGVTGNFCGKPSQL